MRVTIRDVAKAAGVSVATASNVMNNPEIVHPRTRALVREAAEKLHYVPNLNGRRLRARETRTLGLFVNAMRGEYYSTMADSMHLECSRNGYDLQICLVDDAESVLKKLQEHSMDAAVVGFDEVNEETADQMRAVDCPVVFIGMERKSARETSIHFESRQHGLAAADYLVGLGKKSFLHVYGRAENYDSDMRRDGFLEGLRKHGFDPADVPIVTGGLERASAYREMRRYLQEGKPLPEAIFAANDLSAIGTMAALREAGIRVPEDVSIMGCDDIMLCAYVSPTLTTIRTHFQKTGAMAAAEAIRLIRGEEGRVVRQDGSLIVRESCAF